MVGNFSGGEPTSYQDMENSCLKTVIFGGIAVVLLVGLIGYGLVSLIKDLF
jgi:hypothetical protein